MEINYWLNFKDYSTFQLSIALIGSILWVMVYFFLIKDTIQKKYMEMPFFIVCGNFAWEILYAYFFDEYINLGQVYVWGYRAWFFMDIFIFILLLKYGKKQVENPFIVKNFTIINFILLFFFLAIFYGWIREGFDNTPIHGDGSVKLGATSAYILNFGITISYFIYFFKKSNTYIFSKPIAWCKGVGTTLFTILFWQVDPENYLLQILGVLIFAGDTIYIGLLYIYQPQQNEKLDMRKVKFFENKKFNALWKANPSFLTIKDAQVRYYKSDDWTYKSPDGKYETTIGIAEGNIFIEQAKGEVELKHAKAGLDFIEKILKEMELENHEYYYISDTTKITKASFNTRKLVIEFHEKHKHLKQFVLITNGFTRVLIRLMTPINPDVINNWLISNTIENAFYELFKPKRISDPRKLYQETLTEKRINETYEMISKISYREFNKIEPVKISEDDSFYGVFTALEILENDTKDILFEKNTLLNNSQEALKEQELHYKHLFENSYEIIFVVDSNDILVNFNKGAQVHWAQQGMDLKIGFNINNYYISNKANVELYKKTKHELLQGKKKEIELKFKYLDGKKTWLDCRCYPIKLSEKRTYYVYLLKDITAQKELLYEKQMMGQTILNQNTKLNEFSHILSNDLKQQAAIMITVIENLKNSLVYTNINITKVTVLRKALDDMESVITDLDKVLNDNSLSQNEKVRMKIKKS